MSQPVLFNVVIDSQITEITAPAATVNISTASPPFTVVTLAQDGTGTRITGEIPTGVQNSVNLVYTLRNTYRAGSTAVYRNGIRGLDGYDYNETVPNQITFTTAPNADDAIVVDYYLG